MDGALIPILVFLAVYVAITFELANKAVASWTMSSEDAAVAQA